MRSTPTFGLLSSEPFSVGGISSPNLPFYLDGLNAVAVRELGKLDPNIEGDFPATAHVHGWSPLSILDHGGSFPPNRMCADISANIDAHHGVLRRVQLGESVIPQSHQGVLSAVEIYGRL